MDEYISRNGVLFATMQRGINVAAMEVIRDYPAADVVPVVYGRWIESNDVSIVCSRCESFALTEGDYRQVKSTYCPNCGAKMDE